MVMRNFKLMNIVKSSYYVIGCYLMVMFCACRNTPIDTVNQSNGNLTDAELKISDVFGSSYNDSMIAILSKPKSDIIRSNQEALLALDCQSPQLQTGFQFNYDSIQKYKHTITQISTELYAEILGYGCVGIISSQDQHHFKVVFTSMSEAHTSSSINLILFKNDTIAEDKLVLAEVYLSENFERFIESKLNSNSTIVRTILEKASINSKQEKTKIEQFKTIEWYKINHKGEVELLSSELVGFG